MPPPTARNGPPSDAPASQLLHELEALSIALHRHSPPLSRDPPPPPSSQDGIRKVFHLNGGSKREPGNPRLSRREVASSAHAIPLDPAEKAQLQSRLSTSSLLVPFPPVPRDRSVNDRAGLQLWQSRSQSLDSEVPSVGSLKEWVQDSLDFSQKLDVAQQQRQQEKKGFWKWKPFRAIAHMGQQRFHVIFSMHVHRIEGLPASLNGLRLTVHWNRKEEGNQTAPARVIQGVAGFEETLRQRCTVYASKGANQGLKYDSKMFALSVVALDADELEFGKHQLDLSRLLPEFPGSLDEDEKPASWTTNLELTGIGKGSNLVVTFNYDLVHHEAADESDARADRSGSSQSAVHFNSVPSSAHGSPHTMPSSPAVSPSRSEPGAVPDNRIAMEHLRLDDDVRKNSSDQVAGDDNPSPITGLSALHGGLLEFKPTLKYFLKDGEREEGKMDFKFPSTQSEQEDARVTATNKRDADDRTDLLVKESGISTRSSSSVGIADLHGNFEVSNIGSTPTGKGWRESLESDKAMDNRQNTGEDFAGQQIIHKGSHPKAENVFPTDSDADLDDEVDLVAGEFLNLLEVEGTAEDSKYDSEADSPRARLLKQFEREAFLEGSTGLAFDDAALAQGKTHETESKQLITRGSGVPPYMEDHDKRWGSEDTFEMASIMEAAESELQKANQTMRSKSRAKMLEDAETEALFQQWGLNEKSFESSPPRLGPSLGSPFHSAMTKLSAPPPLARGLGSVINLKDGGSLRSMSPSHFPKNRAKGSLVMQVSRPVVVPSAAGSTATDILRHLAAFGKENLAIQAMAAMPLDDITGATPEEVVVAGAASLRRGEGPSLQNKHRYQNTATFDGHNPVELGSNQPFATRKSDVANTHSRAMPSLQKHGGYNEPGSADGYVSLEDVAPIAMQDIEALAISGLKVQADMADEEAPSYLDAAAWGILDSQTKQDRVGLGTSSQGVAGMHFGPFEHEAHKVSERKHNDPLALALTLDEWSRLDAGNFDQADSKNKTLALLAAHKVQHPEWELAAWEEGKGQKHNKKAGIMGNTLMIAMLVQLRDPFKNYEPVGAPMMALVQAERVMVPPKPRFSKNVSVKGNSEVDDELEEVILKKEEEPPQFKVQGVHLAGLKTGNEEEKKGKAEQGQKRGWGFFGWGNQKQKQSGSLWLAAQGMGKTSKPALLKSKPAPTKTQVKPGESLWSISARVHGSGEKWREIAALNPHIRNPDVIFPNDNIRTR